jgi:5,6-dimethylbenzimidazole synthase
LWLAARAEGVGVGWVSILEPDLLRTALKIPTQITLVAYLCLGYVDAFAAEPDLERVGWEKRTALKSVLSFNEYDSNWGGGRPTP